MGDMEATMKKRTYVCVICGRNSKYAEDGKEYCGYHSPSTIAKRYGVPRVVPLNNLRKYRLRSITTQKQLAKASGVSQVTISFIENLLQVPYGLTCVKLAKALGKPVDVVFPAMAGEI